MICPSELVNQLVGHGVALHIENGQLRVKLPWPPSQVHPEARPLLAELKRRRDEVAAWLQWRNKTEAMFREAMKQAQKTCIAEALRWARTERPELFAAIGEVEAWFNEACQSRDMAGCRQAAAAYVQAFRDVAGAYDRRSLTADETARMFGCDRTWNLTDEQVQVLDTVFASPLPVVEAAGKRWYSPEGWRDNYQPAGSAPRGRRRKACE